MGFPGAFSVVKVGAGDRDYILEFFAAQVAAHRPKTLLVVMIGGAKLIIYLKGLVFKMNADEDPMCVRDVNGDK